MDGPLDPESVLRRVEDAGRTAAALQESVASSLERLAGTYRRMAEVTPSASRADTLLDYAAQAESRARRERAEAIWLWSVHADPQRERTLRPHRFGRHEP